MPECDDATGAVDRVEAPVVLVILSMRASCLHMLGRGGDAAPKLRVAGDAAGQVALAVEARTHVHAAATSIDKSRVRCGTVQR